VVWDGVLNHPPTSAFNKYTIWQLSHDDNDSENIVNILMRKGKHSCPIQITPTWYIAGSPPNIWKIG